MDDLKELKSKVEKLDKAENKEERVKILQDIAKSIINEYVIEVGGLTIQPLLIEAYYFDEIKFHDISVHAANESDAKTYKLARERQKNHIGELYVHFSTKDGIDVVLSDGEYYLSFLIKNALIKGEFATQCKISEKLCENCENCDTCNKGYNCIFYNNKVLHKKAIAESGKIVYLPRKGISGKYACAPLAALPLDKIAEKGYDYTLAAGYGKQWRLAVYALEKANNNQEKAKELIKEHKLCDSIEAKYWMLAKEAIIG